MALEVIDSRYGEYKKQLHDLIILVLAKEYPLKIGEICHRLQNEFHIRLSFQAVRKSLNTLVERKVLIITDKSYQIDKNYVLEMKRLSDQLMKNYFVGTKGSKSLPMLKREDITTYEFEDLIHTDQFMNEIIFDIMYDLKENDDHTFLFNGPHAWFIFAHPGMEQEFLEEVSAHNLKLYYLITVDTLLDRWGKKFYERHVKYQILPTKTPLRTFLNIFAGYIIQYDYPEEISTKLEQFYEETTTLESLDLSKIADILKFKTKIKVTVMKNKIIAEKLKEEILSKFKSKE